MLADLAAFVSKLEAAIDDTMQGAVAEGAKEALQEAAYRQVYDTYTPQFLSRRGNAGGIADPGNMTVNYGGMKAGPRPFHQEAERQFAGSGEFDRLLAQGLRAHGFVLK